MILEVAFFMADETTEKAEKPIDTTCNYTCNTYQGAGIRDAKPSGNRAWNQQG